MTQIVQLARRALPLLVLALAAGACDRPDPTEPLASADVIADVVATPEAVAFASSRFRGGIPFGVFHLPKEQYGTTYNGSLGNIYPKYLIEYLEAARRTGTKLLLSFPGSESNYQNSNKSFSLSKWKNHVDRFKDVNFSSYVKDGTVIGHYILDEPHDPTNWGGRTVSPATVDEMAKHSKQRWPDMPTIVRSWPHYLKGHKFKYLDAAWAQYSERHGPAATFITENVRDAKASGLALVVGMNQLGGGSKKGLRGYYDGRYSMNASELEAWGSVLLSNSYPCAFINWKYDSRYMGRSDIKSAMAKLSQKARTHATKSCRAGASDAPSSGGDDDDGDEDDGNNSPPGGGDDDGDDNESPSGGDDDGDDNESPSGGDDDDKEPSSGAGSSTGIQLQVTGKAEKRTHRMTLRWSGAAGSRIDVYRNGEFRTTTENDKKYTNTRDFRGAAKYVYRVCERGSSRCSNEATVSFR
jgi:hypothetical protein